MRTRTRLENLPRHNSQAKSSVHGPCPFRGERGCPDCSYLLNAPPLAFNPGRSGPEAAFMIVASSDRMTTKNIQDHGATRGGAGAGGWGGERGGARVVRVGGAG